MQGKRSERQMQNWIYWTSIPFEANNKGQAWETIQQGERAEDIRVVVSVHSVLPPSVRRIIPLPTNEQLKAAGITTMAIVDGKLVDGVEWWRSEAKRARPGSRYAAFMDAGARFLERSR